MTPLAKLVMTLDAEPVTDHEDDRIASRVIAMCPGWSGLAHYAFFKALLVATRPKRILVAGVYHGRDIGMILSAARRHMPDSIPLVTGVDLFSPDPCADWPEAKRGMSWEQAGFGHAPSLATAAARLKALGVSANAKLVQSRSDAWMGGTEERYDAVYLDTSHDYATLSAELDACRRVVGPHAVICGDDYIDRPEWGVIRCVKERFDKSGIYRSIIWASSIDHLLPKP